MCLIFLARIHKCAVRNHIRLQSSVYNSKTTARQNKKNRLHLTSTVDSRPLPSYTLYFLCLYYPSHILCIFTPYPGHERPPSWLQKSETLYICPSPMKMQKQKKKIFAFPRPNNTCVVLFDKKLKIVNSKS